MFIAVRERVAEGNITAHRIVYHNQAPWHRRRRGIRLRYTTPTVGYLLVLLWTICWWQKKYTNEWWRPDWALDHLTARFRLLPLFSQPPIRDQYWSVWPRGSKWALLCFNTTVTSELWPPTPLPLSQHPSSHPLYTSFAHHIPLSLWGWPPTSLRHLHLLSIKRIGSFPPLNTTFTLGRKEGTCECNQTYT